MGIKKVFVWFIPICAIIALVFYGFGVHYVEFGDSYYRFFSGVFQIESKITISIPNIPRIPTIDNGFVDVLIGFVNGLSTFFNVVISGLNILIEVLMFFISVLLNIINLMSDRSLFPLNIVVSSL